MEKETQVAADKALSFLTVSATFLMGYIDAYTFMEKGGVFVSAQTGNMVAFSSKLFTGNFQAAAGHIAVFAGFALGAFVGEAAIERIKGSGIKRYRNFLLIQIGLLVCLALFQKSLPTSIMVFLLGLLSGYELTIFRKIGITTINDGIMTGNTKNWMNNLYQAIFQKNPTSKQNFKNLSAALLLFIFGVGFGSLVVMVKGTLALWGAAIFSIVILLVLSLAKQSDK